MAAANIADVISKYQVRFPKPLKVLAGQFGLGTWVRSAEAGQTYGKIQMANRAILKQIDALVEEGDAFAQAALKKAYPATQATMTDIWRYYRLPGGVAGSVWGYIGKPMLAFAGWGALFSQYGFARNTTQYQSQYQAAMYFNRGAYL